MNSIDFGNVVNNRKPTAEERFLKRDRHRTLAELAYDCRAHQAAQSLHIIGEAIQAQNYTLASALCEEAIMTLTGLRNILSDGHSN